MPLSAGTRLGPYLIEAAIGAGGMGEVYRARDTKLDREVALKVLPSHLSSDPAALARFEREAKAIAALSHPNILAIHDFGTHEATAYAVMELLDGETLRARVSEGSLPVRKAIDYGMQIARGLAAAHAKAIIHRDLKPDNIFLVHDGRVKILDFGLARHGGPSAGEMTAATRSAHTDPGTVLGTVGYMSPEQVRGDTVDHRSDVFALGAVLYEMLTGVRAFKRDTAAETMTAILREEPPELTETRKDLPPALERIVRHCLEKHLAERFQSASDIAFALEALSTTSSSAVAATMRPAAPLRWRRAAMVVAAASALSAVFVGGLTVGQMTAPSRPESSVPSFRPLTYRGEAIMGAAFAPDGRTVVYDGLDGGRIPDLFTIGDEDVAPRLLVREARLLGVSSKGELALLVRPTRLFHRVYEGTLARMPLKGGAPREVLEDVQDAAWTPDGESYAIVRRVGGVCRLEYPVGTVLYQTTGYLNDPRFSPSGDHIAFLDHAIQGDNRGGVSMVDLRGNRTVLAAGPFWGEEGLAWSPDGKEVLFSAGDSAQGYRAHAVAVATRTERPAFAPPGSVYLLDVARDGRWLLSRETLRVEMPVVAPGAREERDLAWLDFSIIPILSRDGRIVTFSEQSGAVGANYEVCVRGTDGSPVVRLGPGYPFDLSADGRRVLAVVPTSPPELVVYPTGAGEARRLARGPLETYTDARLFADGERLVVCGSEPQRAPRCYIQSLTGSPEPLRPDGILSGLPSPDGRRVALKTEDGRLLEMPLPQGAPRAITTTTRDEILIRWTPDGRALLAARTEPSLRFDRIDIADGRRVTLREIPAAGSGGVESFPGSLSEDGRAYAYSRILRRSQLFVGTDVR